MSGWIIRLFWQTVAQLKNVMNVLKPTGAFNIHHKCLLRKTSVFTKISLSPFLSLGLSLSFTVCLTLSLSLSLWDSLQISPGKPSGWGTSTALSESHYRGSTVSNQLSTAQTHVPSCQQLQTIYNSTVTPSWLFCKLLNRDTRVIWMFCSSCFGLNVSADIYHNVELTNAR